MPELPEVETLRRSLLPHVVGQTLRHVLVRDTRLRFAVDTAVLTAHVQDRRILTVRRRAKYLLFDLEGDLVLMVHLGMSGKLNVMPAARPLLTHDHVIWELEDGRHLRFNDPRRFGMVLSFSREEEATHPRLVHLGAEPLDDAAFTGALLHTWTRGVAKPIKNFLMDGTRIVGVGNIYACESLFMAGVHPARAAGRVSAERCEALAAAVRTVLRKAIEEGGTTLRDFANAEGDAGYFAVSLQAYGREGLPCLRCGAPVARVVQAGRSTFYCPRCQR